MSDKKLQLTTGRRMEIEGCGDDLVLSVRGYRINKLKKYEQYDIELKVNRWTIQQLARQIATMHERDRQRLARETARIQKEIDAIQQPEASS